MQTLADLDLQLLIVGAREVPARRSEDSISEAGLMSREIVRHVHLVPPGRGSFSWSADRFMQ